MKRGRMLHRILMQTSVLSALLASACNVNKADFPSPGAGPATVTDVALPFVTPARSETLNYSPSSFYAALVTHSEGIVTAAGRCRPELLDRLIRFASGVLNVERGAAFIVTVDVTADGETVHDDLPLLVISRADSGERGRICEVAGPAVTANATRITPYFRVDPDLEIQLAFDLKVVEEAQIGAVQAALDYAEQVVALAGGPAAVVGKLGGELAGGLAGSLDRAIGQALTGTTRDQVSADLWRTPPIGSDPHDGVRFDLVSYLQGGQAAGGVASEAAVIVQLDYRRSIIGEGDTVASVRWPSSADTILSFRRTKDSLEGRSFAEALDAGEIPDFNPSFLRAVSDDAPGRELMRRACRVLHQHLENDLEMTEEDALVVRWAALRVKTPYHERSDLWHEDCLSGSYLALAGRGPGIKGESDRLAEFGFTLPGVPEDADWSRVIKERIRDLRRAAILGPASGSLDPSSLVVVIEDPTVVPLGFFQGSPPDGFWTATGEEAIESLKRIAAGGLCARVLTVHTDQRSIRDLALFSRVSGLPDRDVTSWRDDGGRVIVPVVTTWGASSPPRLTELRVAPVSTIRQEYAGTVANWPEDPFIDSCNGIERPPSLVDGS